MNSPDDDGQFVDELLAQAQETLGDPRVRFVHVRHAGAPPADTQNAGPASETNPSLVAQRAAWTQTVELAAALRDLWEHAWLPDPPTVAGVRYLGASPNLRAEVTGHCARTERIALDTVADRLLVRGFLPDDATTPGQIRARNGERVVVVDSPGGGVVMSLTDVLDIGTHATPGTLAALPVQVSLISDDR